MSRPLIALVMLRHLFIVLALLAAPVFAQPATTPPPVGEGQAALHGHVEGPYYISPGEVYRVEIPVLANLGGQINDTDNVVTFQDDYTLHISIACFPQDATQRWELSTRGLKDYLVYYFSNYVMPDFKQMYPGSSVESATFAPGLMDGALLIYTRLPGGSMFTEKASIMGNPEKAPVAKRGNLVFVHREHIYVISSELAERVTEGSAYHKTPAEEDEILHQRLADIVSKMNYRVPPVDETEKPAAAKSAATDK